MRTSLLSLALCSLVSLTAACSARSASAPAYASSSRSYGESSGGADAPMSVASMPASESAPSVDTDTTTAVASASPSAPSPASRASMPALRAQPVRAAHANSPGSAGSSTTPAGSAVRPNEGASATVTQPPANVLLIYNAQIIAMVDHVPTGIDSVIEAATSVGGFLANRTDSTVTVRVPVARFREALGRVEASSTVTSRNVQAEDVTEAFHDLEVRLSNLRSVQTRLQQFLARASNVNDALAVERELERVGAQIDEIEGRMRFLSNRAAYSTITVTLHARPQVNGLPVTNGPVTYPAIPETTLPFEVLEQLGLPRLLMSR